MYMKGVNGKMAEILTRGRSTKRVAKCNCCNSIMAYLPKEIRTRCAVRFYNNFKGGQTCENIGVIGKYITCPDCGSDVEVKENDEYYEDYLDRKAVESFEDD